MVLCRFNPERTQCMSAFRLTLSNLISFKYFTSHYAQFCVDLLHKFFINTLKPTSVIWSNVKKPKWVWMMNMILFIEYAVCRTYQPSPPPLDFSVTFTMRNDKISAASSPSQSNICVGSSQELESLRLYPLEVIPGLLYMGDLKQSQGSLWNLKIRAIVSISQFTQSDFSK